MYILINLIDQNKEETKSAKCTIKVYTLTRTLFEFLFKLENWKFFLRIEKIGLFFFVNSLVSPINKCNNSYFRSKNVLITFTCVYIAISR